MEMEVRWSEISPVARRAIWSGSENSFRCTLAEKPALSASLIKQVRALLNRNTKVCGRKDCGGAWEEPRNGGGVCIGRGKGGYL